MTARREKNRPDGKAILRRCAWAVLTLVGAAGTARGAGLREPAPREFAFEIRLVTYGERLTSYECHPPRLVNIHRRRSLRIVRNTFGECVEVVTHEEEPAEAIDRTRHFVAVADRDRAVRDFVRYACLADAANDDIAFGDETCLRRMKLSLLLDHRRPITDPFFQRDATEHRFSQIFEYVVELEDERKTIWPDP
jgi:hypothetical protein